MPMSHPVSDESLKRFAMRTASPEESRSIVAHLLKGCSFCAKRLRSLEWPAPSAVSYDAVFARLEMASQEPAKALPNSLQEPRELLAELDAYPESRQDIVVRNSRRFWSAGLAELLRDRSHSLRYQDPRRMLRDAQLATCIAERLSSKDSTDRAAIADLQTTCFLQLGHSLRVWGDLDAADQAVASARACRGGIAFNPLAKSLFYECLGSIRRAQFRLQDAIWFHAQAVSICREIGRPRLLARLLVAQAISHVYSGDPETALTLLLEAIPKIVNNPRLTLAACHAVVHCHIDLSQVEEASLRWVELRSLYSRLEDPILCTRGKWLEGRLMLAQGMISAGLKLLQDAREEFAQKGLEYDAALTALDTARGYMQLGRWEEVRHLLAEIRPVLRNRKVERSVLTSCLFLGKALSRASSIHTLTSQ